MKSHNPNNEKQTKLIIINHRGIAKQNKAKNEPKQSNSIQNENKALKIKEANQTKITIKTKIQHFQPKQGKNKPTA